ncbi:unnamed protein product [Vitrella brassicaformis CCMP3155]|uniref:Histone chaperone n=2 Tax=Vitrella brassicaformis TaxID=1169539 RepID=A0A0G4EQC0_VITBC|nr:unnamed protein product [Vitrella brassicaformis CCMP3155]|eukprot:CEL99624.1 unnamed protein product [Vitrella brassicaformis CCMP3155]
MAAINVTNVSVRNNPCKATQPFEFEITFECLQQLEKDLEWKVTYVGSTGVAEDQQFDQYDQTLESVLLGPLTVGVMRFILQTSAPDYSKVPKSDVVGNTVVIITAAYNEQEFLRVGYYLNNFYEDEALDANPPEDPVPDKLTRSILSDKPRVVMKNIRWTDEQEDPNAFVPPPQHLVEAAQAQQQQQGDGSSGGGGGGDTDMGVGEGAGEGARGDDDMDEDDDEEDDDEDEEEEEEEEAGEDGNGEEDIGDEDEDDEDDDEEDEEDEEEEEASMGSGEGGAGLSGNNDNGQNGGNQEGGAGDESSTALPSPPLNQ